MIRDAMIAAGNFFFKWRNQLFPLILVVLYLLVPPLPRLAGHTDWEGPWTLAAGLVVAAGLCLRGLVIGLRYIKRGGVDKKVYAADLVTDGMFGVGRNPLYVGNLAIYAGVFLLHGDPRVIVTGMLLFGIIYQCIVLAEEHYLAAKFGTRYLAYCADVPRWGLRPSRFRAATVGMTFDVRKALLTDYNTIASTILMMLVTEVWRRVAAGPAANMVDSIMPLFFLMAATGLCALTIRIYKKAIARPRIGTFDRQ